MVRRDGAETRKERIKEIAKMVQASLHSSEDGWIPLSNFVAGVMYETGLTKSKVMEYLAVPQAMGQFEIDEINDKILKPRISV